jgi:dynein light chain LC8-type
MAITEKLDAPMSTETGTRDSTPGSGPKAVIKNVDMTEEMQQETVDIASAALEKYNIEKDIAAQIKKEFDRRHGPTWHVVVGKNFGSYVTHGEHSSSVFYSPARRCHTPFLLSDSAFCSTETKHFIYFYVGPLAFLIWKS